MRRSARAREQEQATGFFAVCRSVGETVVVRVKEMTVDHPGLDVPRKALARLGARVPRATKWHPAPNFRRMGSLRDARDDQGWVAQDSPTATVPLPILRSLFHWAATGRLRFERTQEKELCEVLLAWRLSRLATLVQGSEEAGDRRRRLSGRSMRPLPLPVAF